MLYDEKPIGSEFRGSRRHVLDLLSRPDYVSAMNNLLSGTGISVSTADFKMPVSIQETKEATFLEFTTALAEFSGAPLVDLGYRWVDSKYKSQTWDMISQCTIDGTPGILLVEAKAHERELSCSGKLCPADASAKSCENHEFIRELIVEASSQLGSYVDGVQLSIDSHYQLANRLTTAVQLANSGTPVVLLYLGFVGDSYFANDYFRSHNHWQRTMGAYLQGVVPQSLPEQRAHFCRADLIFLIRSMEVAQPSSLQTSAKD